jgi:transposase
MDSQRRDSVEEVLMAKKRNRHTEEFKREAVRLMLSRGERTVGDVAQSIGVTEGDLHRWREKFGGAVRVSASITETPEQEIKRLRKENERLRMEREILKKAAAFFAKENT